MNILHKSFITPRPCGLHIHWLLNNLFTVILKFYNFLYLVSGCEVESSSEKKNYFLTINYSL